jgi:FkbM family methyltransferase
MKKYTVIEVGGNYGNDTQRYSEIENSLVWCFEPVPALFDKLNDMFINTNNVNLVRKAVSDFNGTARFGISDPRYGAANMGCSSLNEFTDNIHNVWHGRGDFNMIEYVDVDVIRMDSFIEENNIEQIDYLHCDAQGSDFQVLKSFGDKINILQAGNLEAANTVSLYKDVDNSADSIILFLKENGFRITKIKNHFGQEIDIDTYKSSTEEIDIYFSR